VALEGVTLTLVSLRKQGSPDQLPRAFFRPFHTMRDCPVCTLLHHLKATRNTCLVFPSLKPHPLLISYVKTHNPITVPTLNHWQRMVSFKLQLGLRWSWQIQITFDVAVTALLFDLPISSPSSAQHVSGR